MPNEALDTAFQLIKKTARFVFTHYITVHKSSNFNNSMRF